MLSAIFTAIATGLTSFGTALFGLIVSLFVGIFCITATEGGAVTGLSPIGELAVAFICIGICYKVLPTVIGWLRLKMKARRARKARAR